MKKNKNKLSRRKFIQDTAKAAVIISASGLATSFSPFTGEHSSKNFIPRRKLGKTGLDVTILSFGGGSQFLRNSNGEWEKVLETAVDGGINLFDTAASYNASSFNQASDDNSLASSEERFGHILPKYRNNIILSTKLETRKPEEARAQLEASLKRLRTDHVDILFIHGIEVEDKIADIENGIYRTMVSFKEAGLTKNIGFSSMGNAEHARDMLEKLDFDVVLLAMNATRYGDMAKSALPAARKKNTGIIAMKLMRDIVGKGATPKELLEYSWTQEGVTTALVGHYGLDTIKENIRLTQEYGETGKSSLNRRELESRLSGLAGPHALCWARPGYKDGKMVVGRMNGYPI